MSESENLASYDFRQPRQLADDVEDLLDSWKTQFAELAGSGWADNLRISMEWSAGALEATRVAEVVDRIGESTIVFEVTVGGENAITWFVVPKRFALLFVMSMLGDQVTELPEDRILTDIETALLEMIAQEICATLKESQPCKEKLSCVHTGMPRFEDIGRRFTTNEQVVLTEFQLRDASLSASVFWLLSNKALLRFVTHVTEFNNRQRAESPELKRLVQEIPIDVVIKLGEARVHFTDLAKMQVGDLLILDQRVTEPLSATVSETVKFRGWPGRIGLRQGFQITQLLTMDNTKST